MNKNKKKDKLQEFGENVSILPLEVSKTGIPDESLTEIIVCSCVSGGADYVDEMPRRLTLLRRLVNGKEFKGEYTIKTISTHNDNKIDYIAWITDPKNENHLNMLIEQAQLRKDQEIHSKDLNEY